MSIIEIEYRDVMNIFQSNEKTFKRRKERIKHMAFSKICWSETYLDFVPYDCAISYNQKRSPRIYKEKGINPIKNHFYEDKVVYSCNDNNENWGSVFIDYNNDYTAWFLFVMNNDEEMMLQQLRLRFHQNGKITKTVSYVLK